MSYLVGQETITYDWEGPKITTSLEPKELGVLLRDYIAQKDIISFGEHHDLNHDTSFNELLDYKRAIFNIYGIYRDSSRFEQQPSLPRAIEHVRRYATEYGDNELMENVNGLVSMLSKPHGNSILQSHPSRIFATLIIPIAKAQGFTDIVLEGFDDRDPSRVFERSKDKVGHLLIMLSSMMVGMRLHGAYSDSWLDLGDLMAEALSNKVNSVKAENPDARVLVYNGMAHNATQPLEGTVPTPLGNFELASISYAPAMIEKYGKSYGAVDLIGGKSDLEGTGHYEWMQQKAGVGVTAYQHGVDQLTMVFK